MKLLFFSLILLFSQRLIATELTAPFGPTEIQEALKYLAESDNLPAAHTDSLGTKYALIPAGSYSAGSTESQVEAANTLRPDWWSDDHARSALEAESTPVPITISRPFYLATTETTILAFRQFVEETQYETEAQRDGRGGMYYDGGKHQDLSITWSDPKPGTPVTDQHPVTQVTSADARAFCAWLSKKDGATYRLPTEAEWEYAARAGTNTLWHFGDHSEHLPDFAVSGDMTFPVASKMPNPFGLFDVYGNVWELTSDFFSPSRSPEPVIDPVGPLSGDQIARRGGNFGSGPTEARSAFRKGSPPDYRGLHVGFRVLREIPD